MPAAAPGPVPRAVRVSITQEGVEIESNYDRDTLTRVANLALRLWNEARTGRTGLSAGMGFTTEIRLDEVTEPDDDPV